MKTKTLFTALALIIGLQLTNAQKLNNANQPENITAQQTTTLFSINYSDWEIVSFDGIQPDLLAIQFSDEDHGYAVGGFGTLIYTNDAGNTWEQHNFGPMIDLHDVHYLDINTGFIVGNAYLGPQSYGIVYKTTNGGQDWDLSYMSESPMVLNSIAFADSQNGILAGHTYEPNGTNGIIIKTDDAGLNWESVPVYNGIMSIDNIMFDNTGNNKSMVVGWATGTMNIGPDEVAVILKSVDLGVNWNTAYVHNGEVGFRDISFYDEKGIAVGDNGTILLTNDAGESWIPLKPVSDTYNAILAGNQNNLWMVGVNGMVLHSVNAGQNWVQQNTPLLTDLNAICSTPNETLWVVGDDGTLMKKQKSPFISNGKMTASGNSSTNAALKNKLISNQTENSSGSLVSHKNFPNPFQSETTIAFELDQRTHVILEVFNINGKLIATLKDQILDAGNYEVMFYANGLPSGIYTYVLRAGSHTESGKMMK